MEDKAKNIMQAKITVMDFNDVPDVEVSWLWKPFIPMSDVTIIEGDGMAGKTTAVIRLASLVSQGLLPPALEHGDLKEMKKCDPMHVLYIGVEANNETEIKPAIKYGKGNMEYFHFLYQGEHPFIIEESYLREAIRQSKCRLLIIDPYTNFLPSGVSLNNSVSMRRLMSMLMNVARDTSTAIVLVGHLSKQLYGKAIYAGYGSGDIINTVRFVLLVSRDEDNIRYLRILKSNYFGVDAFFKVGLSMDDENCVQFEDYEYLRSLQDEDSMTTEDPAKLTRTGQCANAIVALLADGAMKRSDIYQNLGEQGFSERTIARAFSNMGGESYYKGRTVWWRIPSASQE